MCADPIGLTAEINPYSYVKNPLTWIDPLGLYCCPKFGLKNEAFRAAKSDAGIPMGQQPSKVEMVNLTDRDGNNILGDNYKPIKTREYTFTRPGQEDIVIQDHSYGHSYSPEGKPGNQGPHINIRPKSDTRNGHVDGALGHYLLLGEIMNLWTNHLVSTQYIDSIYHSNKPGLNKVDIHEINFHRDGPKISIRINLNDYPENPPKK
mgnify:CR=1 FL=1